MEEGIVLGHNSEETLNFILEKLRDGENHFIVTQMLVDAGVEKEKAEELIAKAEEVLSLMEKEEEILTSKDVMKAISVAALVALIGGLVWGAIAIYSDYEIGLLAIGIGTFTGRWIRSVTNKKGKKLQIIASVFSVLGIFIGKYILSIYALRQFITFEYGAEYAVDLWGMTFGELWFFIENLQYFLGAFDILWIFLAISSAWKVFNEKVKKTKGGLIDFN